MMDEADARCAVPVKISKLPKWQFFPSLTKLIRTHSILNSLVSNEMKSLKDQVAELDTSKPLGTPINSFAPPPTNF